MCNLWQSPTHGGVTFWLTSLSKLCGEFVSKVMSFQCFSSSVVCFLSPFLISPRCFFIFTRRNTLYMDTHTTAEPFKEEIKHCSQKEKIHKIYPVESWTFEESHKMTTHHSVGVAVGYIFIAAGGNCQCQRPFHLKIEAIQGSNRCQNFDRNLWAFVEHPIICETIKKSTDLAQSQRAFAVLHIATDIDHQVLRLSFSCWEIRCTAWLVEKSLFMHIYIHVMFWLWMFILHVCFTFSLLLYLFVSSRSSWLHMFFASISEANTLQFSLNCLHSCSCMAPCRPII